MMESVGMGPVDNDDVHSADKSLLQSPYSSDPSASPKLLLPPGTKALKKCQHSQEGIEPKLMTIMDKSGSVKQPSDDGLEFHSNSGERTVVLSLPVGIKTRKQMEKSTEYENNNNNCSAFIASNSYDKQTPPTSVVAEALSELTLKMEYIRLKENNKSGAMYFCELCEYHLRNDKQVRLHLKSNLDHTSKKLQRNRMNKLHCLPKATDAQLSRLELIVRKVDFINGMDLEYMKSFSSLLESRLTDIVCQSIHPKCKVRLYGSVATRLALKTSNVNCELVCPKEENVSESDALLKLFQILLSSKDEFTDVCTNLSTCWPAIHFRPKTRNGSPLCILSVRNESAFQISRLIKRYVDFRPDLVILARCLRYWANVCDLDRGRQGGVPPYAFDLLLIHFLQQEHYLPVFDDEIYDDEIGVVDHISCDWVVNDTINNHKRTLFNDCEEKWNLGQIWLHFFKYYALIRENNDFIVQIRQKSHVHREEKGWRKKRLAIEDPFIPRKNLVQLSLSMHDYLTECFQMTYEYFGVLRIENGPLVEYNIERNLFLPSGLLCSLSVNDQCEKEVVEESLCTGTDSFAEMTLADSKNLNTKSVIDQSREILHDMPALNEQDVQKATLPLLDGLFKEDKEQSREGIVVNCAENAPQNVDAKVQAFLAIFKSNCEISAESENLGTLPSTVTSSHEYSRESLLHMKSSQTLTADKIALLESYDLLSSNKEVKSSTNFASGQDFLNAMMQQQHVALGARSKVESETVNVMSVESGKSEEKDERYWTVQLRERLETALCRVSSSSICYRFEVDNFRDTKRAEFVCEYCGSLGHPGEGDKCPDFVQRPASLPQQSGNFLSAINDIILSIFEDSRMQKRDWEGMERVQNAVCLALSELFPPYLGPCTASLFGSARNGFGFRHSDVDLCLCFDTHPLLPPDINPNEAIEKMAGVLQTEPGFDHVLAVVNAKVPIVKFRCRLGSNIRDVYAGDISLYNTLGLRNTELLWQYSKVDSRVRKLGIMAKYWAKMCDIGDASKGSLSSYAYIILMIHYLQRCNPPVIPVLQECCRPSRDIIDSNYTVDGCDVYFCKNPLRKHVDNGNRQSLAQLWIGFVDYYARVFSFDSDVVQIRTKQTVTKLHKFWTGRCLAIEDPFDLQHNLAAGITRKMFLHLLKCFLRCRQVFGEESVAFTSFSSDSTEQKLYKHMLRACVLDQAPPRDRQCRKCGRIGHYADTCPLSRKNRQNENPHNNARQTTYDRPAPNMLSRR